MISRADLQDFILKDNVEAYPHKLNVFNQTKFFNVHERTMQVVFGIAGSAAKGAPHPEIITRARPFAQLEEVILEDGSFLSYYVPWTKEGLQRFNEQNEEIEENKKTYQEGNPLLCAWLHSNVEVTVIRTLKHKHKEAYETAKANKDGVAFYKLLKTVLHEEAKKNSQDIRDKWTDLLHRGDDMATFVYHFYDLMEEVESAEEKLMLDYEKVEQLKKAVGKKKYAIALGSCLTKEKNDPAYGTFWDITDALIKSEASANKRKEGVEGRTSDNPGQQPEEKTRATGKRKLRERLDEEKAEKPMVMQAFLAQQVQTQANSDPGKKPEGEKGEKGDNLCLPCWNCGRKRHRAENHFETAAPMYFFDLVEGAKSLDKRKQEADAIEAEQLGLLEKYQAMHGGGVQGVALRGPFDPASDLGKLVIGGKITLAKGSQLEPEHRILMAQAAYLRLELKELIAIKSREQTALEKRKAIDEPGVVGWIQTKNSRNLRSGDPTCHAGDAREFTVCAHSTGHPGRTAYCTYHLTDSISGAPCGVCQRSR
jgi:hypothetical protein